MGGRSGQSIARASSASADVDSIGSVEGRIRTQNFESAAIFKNGKQLLFKDGQASSVSFSPDEVSLMKGAVFTHNHPGGRSFSLEDVSIFNHSGMKEIRAVGNGVEYSLVRTAKSRKVTTKNLRSYYLDEETAKRYDFNRAINEGRMTIEFANANHHHEVMIEVAAAMGLTYTRKYI